MNTHFQNLCVKEARIALVKKKKLGLVGIAEYRNLIKHQIHFRELGLIINRRHTI